MKIVIIGATGMLGHKLYMKLADGFDCYAIARMSYSAVKDFNIFKQDRFVGDVDIKKEGQLLTHLNKIRPEAILNCVGLTTRKICESKISDLIYINSYFPHQLAEWCNGNSCRLIHFSTDCVFSGAMGGYTEDDSPDARDHYGLSKLLGEVTSETSLTLRSSIVGLEIFHKTELFEWLVSQKAKKASGYSKVYYSGVTTNYMAHMVSLILKHHPDLNGLFHLASPKISKYDLLQKLNAALELNVKLVESSDYKSDKSLDSTRLLKRLPNAEKPNWNSMIEEIKQDYPRYQRWAENGFKR